LVYIYAKEISSIQSGQSLLRSLLSLIRGQKIEPGRVCYGNRFNLGPSGQRNNSCVNVGEQYPTNMADFTTLQISG
jgi:hypothetical protein